VSVPPPNYYEILGVNPDATDKEIESRYRALALELHPDWHTDATVGVDKSAKMAEVDVAFHCLSDPITRSAYNGWLTLSKDSGETPEFVKSQSKFARAPEPTECVFCAHSPTLEITLKREIGLVFRRRTIRYHGRYCRDCGMALFRDTQNATLISGWWGIICAPVNVGTIVSNYREYKRLRELAEPTPPTVPVTVERVTPAPVGKTMVKRPGVWLTPIFVAALVVYGSYYLPKAFERQGYNYQVGACVTVNNNDVTGVVSCSQTHDAKIVSIGATETDCPGNTTQIVKERTGDAQPGDIACLDDTQ
jgi:hypothetical protein